MSDSIPRMDGRRLSSTFLLFVIILTLGFTSGLLVVSPTAQPAHAESLGTWTSTTNYSTPTSPMTCVTYGDYIYCVEGLQTSAAYYAPVSSSGIGAWIQTTSFPQVGVPTCTASGGYIYCVGLSGYATSPDYTTSVYYALLTASGIGTWMNTTGFPSITTQPLGSNQSYTFAIAAQSCATAEGYIYCVATPGPIGPEPYGAASPDMVYYATVSSSGVGAWTQTTTYPSYLQGQDCVVTPSATSGSSQFVYCIGGDVPPYDGETETFASGTVDYAPVLPSGGLGVWTSTTSYPLEITGQSCFTSGGYVYCVAGGVFVDGAAATNGYKNAVYYAHVAPSGGISGGWVSTTTNYPLNDSGLACVPNSGYAYCVGGEISSSAGERSFTGAAYFTPISSSQTSTSPLTVTTIDQSGNPIEGYYTVLYDSGGNFVTTGFSPSTFTLNNGQTYTLQVDDYGSCHFDHWSDTGSNAASRAISITSDTELTAVYSCGGGSSSSSASSVAIDSVDQNGEAIFGYYAVLYNSSMSVVGTGFTTTQTFATTTGDTYQVQADSYGSCTFTNWSDGVTSDPRSFTATNGASNFTAVYNCTTSPSRTATIEVSAVNSGGEPIYGYYISLWLNGVQVGSCFSTCSFSVSYGSATFQVYQLIAASYGSETFSHWDDGSTGPRNVDEPNAYSYTTLSITAYYTP